MNDRAITPYDSMIHQIAECHRVDDVKEIHDKAIAMEEYARRAMNLDAERQCAQIRIRCEKRAAEMMRDLERKQGDRTDLTSGSARRKSEYAETLERTKIPDRTARHWQQLADVPEAEFEEALAAPGIPTTSGIIESHKARTAAKPERQLMSDEALWLWGRLCDFESMGFFDSDLDALVNEMTTNMRADTLRILPLLLQWLRSK